MSVKLLTKQHLECLSLKGGCRGSSESTHVKMPHRWKSHVLAQIVPLTLCLLNESSWQANLFSGFQTRLTSNQPAQLQSLARNLKYLSEANLRYTLQ